MSVFPTSHVKENTSAPDLMSIALECVRLCLRPSRKEKKPSHPMNPIIAAIIAIPSLAIAAEIPPPATTANQEPWSLTLFRSTADGGILSEAKTPIQLHEGDDGGFYGVISINMGSASAPRMWTVDFNSELNDMIFFQIRDPALVFPSFNGNGSSFIAATLFESSTSWQGPGRYTVLSLNGEKLVAEIGPDNKDHGKPQDRPSRQIIELVRTDREGKVIGRASTSWSKYGIQKRISTDLTLRPSNNDPFLLRHVRCRYDDSLKSMAFRISDWFPINRDPAPTVVRSSVAFDVWIPIQSEGPYTVYKLDGETLEARIIPADSPAGR